MSIVCVVYQSVCVCTVDTVPGTVWWCILNLHVFFFTICPFLRRALVKQARAKLRRRCQQVQESLVRSEGEREERERERGERGY